MTSVHEFLRMRIDGARARFLDDLITTLKEGTSNTQPIDIEKEFQEQINHGRRILQMAQSACGDLAAYGKLAPEIHKAFIEALAEASRFFRSLQNSITGWMKPNQTTILSAQELDPLIRQLDDCRAELIAAGPDVFPGLELDRVKQAIHDLDSGKERRLDTFLAELGH